MISAGIFGGVALFVFKKWHFSANVQVSDLAERRELIASLADTIIPGTSSPGAGEAGVASYIVLYLNDCATENERSRFLSGLERVTAYATRKFDAPFERCNQADRIRILTKFERQSTFGIAILDKIRDRVFGEPFIIQLKRLTVVGYCTSELGATRGLAYDYIPVVYEPCMALTPDQRVWSTN